MSWGRFCRAPPIPANRAARHPGIIAPRGAHDAEAEPYSISLPNFNLRAASSAGELGHWYAIGEAWAQIASAFLPASGSVLDIGCGCGKVAFAAAAHLRTKVRIGNVYGQEVYALARTPGATRV